MEVDERADEADDDDVVAALPLFLITSLGGNSRVLPATFAAVVGTFGVTFGLRTSLTLVGRCIDAEDNAPPPDDLLALLVLLILPLGAAGRLADDDECQFSFGMRPPLLDDSAAAATAGLPLALLLPPFSFGMRPNDGAAAGSASSSALRRSRPS